MIDSMFNLIFRCRHRRMSFPFRPVSRTGESQPDTYVVCLDCAKQFAYDWEHMRVGKPVALPAKTDGHAGHSRLRVLMWATALPAVWLIGTVFKRGPRPPGENRPS